MMNSLEGVLILTIKSVIESFGSLWWPVVDVPMRSLKRTLKTDAESIHNDWSKVMGDLNKFMTEYVRRPEKEPARQGRDV